MLKQWTITTPEGREHVIQYDTEPPKSGYWPKGWIGGENLPGDLIQFLMRAPEGGAFKGYSWKRDADVK